jgi:hypothetical protein
MSRIFPSWSTARHRYRLKSSDLPQSPDLLRLLALTGTVESRVDGVTFYVSAQPQRPRLSILKRS